MGVLGGFNAVCTVLIAISGLCAWSIYSMDMRFTKVTISEILSSSVLTSQQLFLVRLCCGMVVWSTCLHILTDRTGITLRIPTPYGRPKVLFMRHFERFAAFTQWSWVMQAWYFGITTVLYFISEYRPEILMDPAFGVKPYLPTVASVLWIMYELSVTMAFLVTTIVTFVLIPATEKKGLSADNYYRPLPLIMHNFNVLFMSLELGLNNVRFHLPHLAFAALWGIAYVFFAWLWYRYTGVFFYFFLDYNHPFAALYHLGLVGLMAFFFIACSIMGNYVDTHAVGNIFNTPFLCLMAFTISIMKWPRLEEWDKHVFRAIIDTWNRKPYVQPPFSKKQLAIALKGATLKEEKGMAKVDNVDDEDDAPVPIKRSSRRLARGGVGRSRSRSRSSGRKRG